MNILVRARKHCAFQDGYHFDRPRLQKFWNTAWKMFRLLTKAEA